MCLCVTILHGWLNCLDIVGLILIFFTSLVMYVQLLFAKCGVSRKIASLTPDSRITSQTTQLEFLPSILKKQNKSKFPTASST